MKLDKTAIRELEKVIKQTAKTYGYKYISGGIFTKISDNFVDSVNVVIDRSKVSYHIRIKKLSYDDLFWDIMNMPDNKLQPLSFRVNGAFKSPSIILAMGEIGLDEDLEGIAEKYCSIVSETAKSFLDSTSVGDYVLTKGSSPYAPVLKCLEHLIRNDANAALDIANSAIASGNSGGFSNDGKNFFEWVVHRY